MYPSILNRFPVIQPVSSKHLAFYLLFDFDFVSVLLGLSFGVGLYTIRVTISCIYYYLVFTISFILLHY